VVRADQAYGRIRERAVVKFRDVMPPITLLPVNNGIWLSIDSKDGGKFAFISVQDLIDWLADYYKKCE